MTSAEVRRGATRQGPKGLSSRKNDPSSRGLEGHVVAALRVEQIRTDGFLERVPERDLRLFRPVDGPRLRTLRGTERQRHRQRPSRQPAAKLPELAHS